MKKVYTFDGNNFPEPALNVKMNERELDEFRNRLEKSG